MRFNPPPNWPRLPDGWSPPPGWQPDPSWPQPPWGWPLWVEDDEPTVSMSPSTEQWQTRRRALQAPDPAPWYRGTLAVVLFLVIFFPVGLALLWMRTDWSVRRRSVVTGFVAVFVIIAAAANNPKTPTTTQLSPPTTSLGIGSSSGADAGASASTGLTGSTTAATTSMAAPTSTAPAGVGPTQSSAAAAVAAPPPAPAPSTYAPPPPPAPPATTAAPPPPPQPSLCGAPSNPYGYNFCGTGGFVSSPPGDICTYFNCIGNFSNGHGYMVECSDGMYSMSGGIRGACSHHGGESRPVYGG
jgi:hypothetical protein